MGKLNNISAIIPMYNAENSVSAAISSIIKQTYKGKIEVIVVNDGSTDNSCEVVERFIEAHNKEKNANREIKIINKQNGGVSSARNVGILSSKGKWVAFLDADDMWIEDKLEKQMEAMQKDDMEAIGCNLCGVKYPFFRKSNQEIFELSAKETLWKVYPPIMSLLAKRQFLLSNNLLFDESMSYCEDMDFLVRICQYTNLHVLNLDLVVYDPTKRPFGDLGLSANLSKMHKGEIISINNAKKRGQINAAEHLFFRFYYFLKYMRRVIITQWYKRKERK